MSLPISGGGPPRTPTHQAIPMPTLLGIAGELDEALDLIGAEELSPAVVEELAEDLGKSVIEVYAAAALFSQIPFASEHDTQFEVCLGECQKWGAAELVSQLHSYCMNESRDDGPSFSLVLRRCMDNCFEAPMVKVHTPDGVAAFAKASTDDIANTIEHLSTEE